MSDQVVSIRQLRQVVDRLLDDIERRSGGDSVELTADSYWVVDPRVAYDLAEPPAESLTVGQLSDDVAELTAVATSPEPPVVWHDLRHVVGILQRLAAQDLP